ncbi:hypothetical protein ACFYXF_01380 [Streptomyces sp. NPDC002680]|uniref:hypothetical protein n=1 Tax=Streptomyces sp. NPDC002680 TaxID=3364659 RepID=UPI0036C52DBA
MRRSVVFVHGTGVRTAAHLATLDRIAARVGAERPEIEVRGCLWGPTEGASARLGGVSVPDHGRTEDGGGDATAEEEDLAAWSVLYLDPWYELRLLGLQLPLATGLSAPHTGPPWQRFLTAVNQYVPTPRVVAALEEYRAVETFERALAQLRRSDELGHAARTIDGEGYQHRHAVARALVACTLALAAQDGADFPDGNGRETLVALLSSDLQAQGRSLPGRLRRVAAAPALRVAERRALRRQGAPSGDILRYQARGEGIRQLVRRTIEDTPGDAITLMAHSLGGVACVDLLVQEAVPRVDQLITVGSQVGHLYEIGALVSLEPPQPLPAHFTARWLNIYDRRDMLAYCAESVFPGRAHDKLVDNRQPFPQAHSAYWTNNDVWKAALRWMG